jgi:hypothetical protein
MDIEEYVTDIITAADGKPGPSRRTAVREILRKALADGRRTKDVQAPFKVDQWDTCDDSFAVIIGPGLEGLQAAFPADDAGWAQAQLWADRLNGAAALWSKPQEPFVEPYQDAEGWVHPSYPQEEVGQEGQFRAEKGRSDISIIDDVLGACIAHTKSTRQAKRILEALAAFEGSRG